MANGKHRATLNSPPAPRPRLRRIVPDEDYNLGAFGDLSQQERAQSVLESHRQWALGLSKEELIEAFLTKVYFEFLYWESARKKGQEAASFRKQFLEKDRELAKWEIAAGAEKRLNNLRGQEKRLDQWDKAEEWALNWWRSDQAKHSAKGRIQRFVDAYEVSGRMVQTPQARNRDASAPKKQIEHLLAYAKGKARSKRETHARKLARAKEALELQKELRTTVK